MSPGLPDDVRRQLLARRVILMSGPMDDVAAGQVAATLMTLDASGDEPVVLQLQGTQGLFGPSLAVMDTVDLLGVPVHARCTGLVSGGPVGIVAVSHGRWASAHASLHLCDPPAVAEGSFSTLERWADEHRRTRDRFAERLSVATGRRVEGVIGDLEAGRWLDAAQALHYGLLDEVGGGPPRPVPPEGS